MRPLHKKSSGRERRKCGGGAVPPSRLPFPSVVKATVDFGGAEDERKSRD